MQQKIQFVATVMHEPELIILDEPFSGFDPINANLIKDEILELREKGSTIIFSTHRMESVEELCDNIALIDKSKVVLDGTKKDIKSQFKDNSYKIKYKGTINNLPASFEFINQKNEDGIAQADIKINSDGTVNQLIESLLNQVDLIAFQENIPSFNEIFIKAVDGVHEEVV